MGGDIKFDESCSEATFQASELDYEEAQNNMYKTSITSYDSQSRRVRANSRRQVSPTPKKWSSRIVWTRCGRSEWRVGCSICGDRRGVGAAAACAELEWQ